MKFRFIIKHVLSYVNFFGMQAPIDAERIADIGADQSNVAVTGNMKFDQVSTVGAESFGQFFRGDNVKIIVAGSTHPGEEEMIIRVFNALKEKHYNARLIIAPRHVERVSEVEAILKKEQCLFSKFSENIDASQRHYGEDILLVDTIGHLRSLYALADIVFVGKSLTGHGGQNILEPAFFAKPIIVGPHMENFRAIKDLFLKAEALIIVRNEQELQQSIIDLLENQPKATKLGKNGYDVVKAQQGSVEKTFKEVQRFL